MLKTPFNFFPSILPFSPYVYQKINKQNSLNLFKSSKN